MASIPTSTNTWLLHSTPGRLVGTESFPADAGGYKALFGWLEGSSGSSFLCPLSSLSPEFGVDIDRSVTGAGWVLIRRRPHRLLTIVSMMPSTITTIMAFRPPLLGGWTSHYSGPFHQLWRRSPKGPHGTPGQRRKKPPRRNLNRSPHALPRKEGSGACR